MKNIILILMLIFCNLLIIDILVAQEESLVALNTEIKTQKNVCIVAVSPTDKGYNITFKNEAVSTNYATGEKRQHIPSWNRADYSVSALDNSVSEITNPRDNRLRLLSGKTHNKSFTKTKVNDNNASKSNKLCTLSGGKAVKTSIQDLHFRIISDGESVLLTSENGVCYLPTNLPDGTVKLVVSCSWGETQSSSNNRCVVDFLLEIKDGAYVSITE
jgi:hypothetical protein